MKAAGEGAKAVTDSLKSPGSSNNRVLTTGILCGNSIGCTQISSSSSDEFIMRGQPLDAYFMGGWSSAISLHRTTGGVPQPTTEPISNEPHQHDRSAVVTIFSALLLVAVAWELRLASLFQPATAGFVFGAENQTQEIY